MGQTHLSIKGRDFYINDQLTYHEIKDHPKSHGLLMNARFIQGIFDDQTDARRFDRFQKTFDPEKNNDDLIAALPEWYRYGLRAITVGMQGGMPVFTIDIKTIDNNPFGPDGKTFDEAYAKRLDKLISTADQLSMVVIVNILYWAQAQRFKDDDALVSALIEAALFLKKGKYTNVIIDLANEYNIDMWDSLPIIKDPKSMAKLIHLVKEKSGGMLVGSSGGCGLIDQVVVDASDVVLIHGNGLTRGEYYDFILHVQNMAPDKPILCNEDSPCVSRLDVAHLTHTSWGHYDNFTKQEVPCDWTVTKGQDFYFAYRMALCLGIPLEKLSREDHFYLQGLEPHTSWEGRRWIRLAALYPEVIDHVNFYLNDTFIYRSYDEPFFLYRETTWIQRAWYIKESDENWRAEIVLSDGTIINKLQEIK
ncbi:MAG: cellulase family glycosylhydrolase [Candidatus Izemoplasmataceae bacterium]